MQVRLPSDLYDALKDRAHTKGDSINATIVRALRYAMTQVADSQTMTITETTTKTRKVTL